MLDVHRLHDLREQRFALPSFRRGQEEIITDILSAHDTVAVMPTGGGKSLCYQLPALYRQAIVLVISPLISLMKDQVQALKNQGIAAGCLHSSQDEGERKQVFADLRENAAFLLYLSPERVQKPGFLDWFRRASIAFVAIDEAHCVSQWGHDFRPDYGKLRALREARPEIPIIALTATATPQVLKDIAHQLGLKNPSRHVYGFYRPNLYYQVEFCEHEADKINFLRGALKKFSEGRVIIYAGTRKNCEELSQTLSREFAQIDYYHAGMNADERARVQSEFEKGHTRILVATNAFGMGIDHPDIRLVVHHQMPGNIESYYQEMGRAGRDGNPSTCMLLYSKKDKGLHAYFITQSDAPPAVVQQRWRALDTIVQFAEGGECRHSGILTYFKDTQRLGRCGHCDVCDPSSSRRVVKAAASTVKQEVKPSVKTRRKKADSRDTSPLDAREQILFDRLRSWRQHYATHRDVPAFLVFSNKTLHDLVKRKPLTIQDLGAVYGLGDQKIEAFGRELIKELQA